MMAVSYEDRPVADTAYTAIMHYLQRLVEDEKDVAAIETFRAVLTMYRDDDVSYLRESLILNKTMNVLALMWLLFLSERGQVSPDSVIEIVSQQPIELRRFFNAMLEVALALKAGDNEQLLKAIEMAEAGQLFVHAARMRIVLAQRTGDRSHLDRAREVLERIQDRRFLRRLEEVESLIK